MHSIQKLISKTSDKDPGLTLDLHNNRLGAGCLTHVSRAPRTSRILCFSLLEVFWLSISVANVVVMIIGADVSVYSDSCTFRSAGSVWQQIN